MSSSLTVLADGTLKLGLNLPSLAVLAVASGLGANLGAAAWGLRRRTPAESEIEIGRKAAMGVPPEPGAPGRSRARVPEGPSGSSSDG